jgi:Asp-tRNA(Asn)/Glu-tRNA(Gln) amidotransferase A subunit family amidase
LHLYDLTIHEAAARLERGEITSLALTEAVIERILALSRTSSA